MKDLIQKAINFKTNRRTFIGAAAASTAALTMMNGLKTLPKATAAEIAAKDGEWVTAACWHNCGGRCLLKAYVVDGMPIRVKTDDVDKDSPEFPQIRACARGMSQRIQVLNADRLKSPMRRKNWEPGGGKKELRGKDEWVRLSWEEALDLTANEMKRIKEDHGDEAILSWGGEISRTLRAFGGAVGAWGNTSWGTWFYAGRDMGLGDGWSIRPINDRLDLLNSNLIVMWGANPVWSSGNSISYNYLQAKKAGAKFIFIDPYYNDTAQVLADEWIPIRPATDHAFALAVAYALLDEDDPATNPLIDWDFLKKCTVGFDAESMPEGADPKENFKDYVLGNLDNIPKTPEWASDICGVDPEIIREFAREIGKTEKVALITGWAPARVNANDSWPQAFMTLGCMTGNIGQSGKMTGISCHFVGGNGGPSLIRSGGSGVPGISNPINVSINNNEIWDAVLTGKYIAGKDDVKDCNIQMIYHGGASRLNQLVGSRKGIDAHRHVEFVVSNHYSMATNPKYSDIVFPVTTMWERFGHLRPGTEHLVYAKQVLEPLYEAKDDIWVAKELAARLGIDPDLIMPLSAKQQIFNQLRGASVIKEDGSGFEPLVTITEADIAAWGVEGEPQQGRITLKEYEERGIYKVKRSPGDALTYIHLQDFVADPENSPLGTDSGKLEIYCNKIAERVKGFGFTEMDPLPKYTPPIEGYEDTFADWNSKTKGEFPYQLYTIHFPRRSHSIFDNIPWLREAWEDSLYMNASDGKSLGLENGDVVKVTSRHGSVIRPVTLTERMKPGVTTIGQGAWIEMNEEEDVCMAGNTNILNGAIPTGQGHMGWNSCNVKVEKYTGSIDLLPDHKWPPRTVF